MALFEYIIRQLARLWMSRRQAPQIRPLTYAEARAMAQRDIELNAAELLEMDREWREGGIVPIPQFPPRNDFLLFWGSCFIIVVLLLGILCFVALIASFMKRQYHDANRKHFGQKHFLTTKWQL